MRKAFYTLGMALLAGLLVIGAFAVGTVLKATGYNGTVLSTVLMGIITALYAISFLFTFFRKQPAKLFSPELKKQMTVSLVYQIFLFLLLLASTFFCGTSHGSVPTVFLLFVAYHIYSYLSTAFMTFDAMTEGEEANENAYPEIYRIARRAAQSAAMPEALEIRIFFRANFSVSCVQFDKELRILLGTHLPAIMNDYELEAVITSELGLILGGSPNVDVALRRRITHWQASVKNDVMFLPNFFTAYPAMQIAAKAERYFLACSGEDEMRRLEAVRRYGIPSDYIGAYAKMIAYDLFLYTPCRKNPYEGEQPPQDFQECLMREYREFLATPMPLFRDAVLHHTPYEEAISLHHRMEFLDSNAFSVERTVLNDAYLDEGERILKIGNEDFADEFAERYNRQRREHYLTPKAITEQYDTRVLAGEEPTDTETIEVVSALRAIGKPARAEALLDALLAKDPSHALASEGKGQFLLERYDPEGIRYLEAAMRENGFSEERNLHLIRSFYQRVGDWEKEQAMAKRDDSAREREINRSQVFHNLTRAEDFKAPPLPQEVIEAVASEIRKQIGEHLAMAYLVGCHEEALKGITYLAVKTKSPPSSPKVSLAMKRLFLYLDNRSELFCLIHLEDKPMLESLVSEIDGIIIVTPNE